MVSFSGAHQKSIHFSYLAFCKVKHKLEKRTLKRKNRDHEIFFKKVGVKKNDLILKMPSIREMAKWFLKGQSSPFDFLSAVRMHSKHSAFTAEARGRKLSNLLSN